MADIARTERFEALRMRLREAEASLHPLHAETCDLDSLELFINALPKVVSGRERLEVVYASKPSGAAGSVLRKTVPPRSKPGMRMGFQGVKGEGPEAGE